MIEDKVLFKNKFLNWNDVTKSVDSICADIILSNIQIDSILGLSRGGLIPAVMIANQLGVSRVYSYGLRSYSNKTGGDVMTYQHCGAGDISGEHVLIVDDISDRGESLGYVKNQLTMKLFDQSDINFHTCTVCKKPHTNFEPTWNGLVVDNDEWVIFPWESDEIKPSDK